MQLDPALVWPGLFGIGCTLTIWSAWKSGDAAARSGAWSLAAVWAMANAAWQENLMWLLPAIDLGLGVAFLQLWGMTRTRWVALLVNAVAIRLILHILDMLTGHLFEVPYIHALNATFVWMLVVVASSGSGHVRDTLLHRFRRFRAVLSPAPARGLRNGR